MENQYGRAVRYDGNLHSRKLIDDVFEICDRKWRGVGIIPKSGYKLRYEYRDHDAERIFEVDDIESETEKAKSLGATLVKNSVEVPGAGWLSIIVDPTGATLGLWQTKKN